MNVLLVNTNRMKPAIAPIGLDYLADSLVAAGHETRLLDLCFSEALAADIHGAFRDFEPQAIGVTVRNTDDCYISSQAFFLPEITGIIRTLRRVSDAPIVLGGVGFSVNPEATLEFCNAELGIAGEGETGFVQLLRALEEGTDLSSVPHLVFRDNGWIRRNPGAPADLARLPLRRRAFVDNARYFRRGGQAGFETKRGCPMHCVYCADPVSKGHITRLLPPAAVVAELSALLAQGIDHLHTCDCEFNLPAEHACDVCRAIIGAGLGERIRWYAYCAPTPFSDEIASLFRRAGCAGINFGADSGCDEMLRRLGRHFTTEDLGQTANLCRRHGLAFMYDLLLGSPGETRETLHQTIDFARRVAPDCVGLSLGVRLHDGTPLARQLRTEGDPACNPNLCGARCDNPHFLKPVFYISPDLGKDLIGCTRELVAGDPRFFLPDDTPENANYNYSDNLALVRAIDDGARGAYWDILRRLPTGRNCASDRGSPAAAEVRAETEARQGSSDEGQ